MATSTTPIFPQAVKAWGVQILPADTTTKKTLITAGANGSIVEALMVSNTDTIGYTLQLFMNDGSTDHLIGSVFVTANAGSINSSPTVAALGGTQIPSLIPDSNGNLVLYLMAGWLLKVAVTVTVTATKVVDCVAMGMDY